MTENITEKTTGDVWFVYDGDCPICKMAAQALRIKQSVGTLHLLNARADKTHPVVQEVTKLKLDLDEGMVLKIGGHYYHGEDALQMMAFLSSGQGWLNRLNATLFKSRAMARICYPVMRFARNMLLRLRGVRKINNLADEYNDPENPL